MSPGDYDMSTTPTPIDDYLAKLPETQQVALERLRQTIRKLVPDAEECINYGLAGFRYQGKMLVAIGASRQHCGFYPLSGTIVEEFADQLGNFETSKGVIRFQPEKPIPVTLIRKIVKARMKGR